MTRPVAALAAETVSQLRAAGWSEEKIAAAAERRAAREAARLDRYLRPTREAPVHEESS